MSRTFLFYRLNLYFEVETRLKGKKSTTKKYFHLRIFYFISSR